MADQLVPKAGPWLLGIAAGIAAMVSFPEEARPISCISGPFMIFFDLNEAEITSDDRDILDDVIAARGTCGDGRLIIVGHSDRSGANSYNLSLSRRRAESVRAYALMQGVPDEAMKIEVLGESHPFVETPDGVQEPRNRRVEIVFT